MSGATTVSRGAKFAQGANAAMMITAVLGLVVGLNWASRSSYARLDLSQNKVNSLSDASLEAAQSMPGLEIRFYRSPKLPKQLAPDGATVEQGGIKNVPLFVQQVEDKLEEYKRASNGQLTWSTVSNDLDKLSGSLNLVGLKIPRDKTADADPDIENSSFYLALSLHYRTAEEIVPVIAKPETLEYEITKSLLRLRAKQADSVVQRDLLDSGKELNEAVQKCLDAIAKYDKAAEKKDDDIEGGLVEQAQNQQNERQAQVLAYTQKLDEIDAVCGNVGTLLDAARKSVDTKTGTDRQTSREHYDRLMSRIGWFHGLYGAWKARLIGEAKDPGLVDQLTKLLSHPEVPARTTALRVLGEMTGGSPTGGAPVLQGPPAETALRAIRGAVEDTDPVVRSVAVQMIASAAGAQASAEILKALKDTDATVREVALDLAMQLKIDVEPSAVQPFLKDADWQVRRMALAYLIDKRAELGLIRPLVDDQNREVQFLAAYGLALAQDKASLDKIQAVYATLPPGQARDALDTAVKAMMGPAPAPAPEGAAPPAPEGAAPPPPAPEGAAPAAPEGAAPAAPTGAAPAAAAPNAPPGGPAGPPPPQPGGGVRKALGRAGLDRLGDVEVPDAVQGLKALKDLKTEIDQAYNALKDSPGKKTIGFLCGHGEMCPFASNKPMIPPELAQAFEQQPFVKKAVDDIKNLEDRLNQHSEAIRQFFLSKGYRFEKVEAGKPIPESIDALVVYGPRKPFKDIDLYDLDQFILTGKPVMFFVNNYLAEVNQWDDSAPYGLTTRIGSVDTNLDAFLSHYRVQNQKDLVMEGEKGRQEKINTVAMQMSNLGPIPMSAKYSYPLFPIFETFNTSDPLVAGLRRVVLPFVSSFKDSAQGQPGLEYHALITSSATAVAKSKDFTLDPKVLRDVIVNETITGPHDVAARVSGDGTSYFAGRGRPERPKPEAPQAEEGQPPPKPEEIKELSQKDKGLVNVVVVGSNLGFEDLSSDRVLDGFNIGAIAQEKVTGLGAAIPYYIRYVNAWGRFIGFQNPVHLGQRGNVTQLPGQQVDFWQKNLDFLFGMFDWATGDSGLAQVRAKADDDRPLAFKTDTQKKVLSYGLVFGLPAGFILLALVRFAFRRAARRRLTAA